MKTNIEYNKKQREELYYFWLDISNELRENIKKIILSDNKKYNELIEWFEFYSLNLNNENSDIELAINILIYNSTFYLIEKLNLKECYINNTSNNVKLLENILSKDSIDISILNNIDKKIIKLIINEYETKSLLINYIYEIINHTDLNKLAIIYEDIICGRHRKENGEFYTEDSISKFISTLCMKSHNNQDIKNILDPMSGNGMFLKNINDKNKKINLWGIEKNKFTSYICNQVLTSDREQDNINIINKNLFDIDVYRGNTVETVDNKKINIPTQGFDIILGNPAYIRYQSLKYMIESIPYDIKEFYEKIGNNLDNDSEKTRFVNLYIRSILMSKNNSKEEILNNLNELSRYKKIKIYKEDDNWDRLIKSYSGLSDSTIPTWFLSYKLCKENGILGFITSDSWLRKEYGNYLKKFLVNSTKIKFILDMSNVECFEDAQVNTSIVIAEKSSCINNNLTNNINIIKFKLINNKKIDLNEVLTSILLKNNIEIKESLYSEFIKFIEDLNYDYEDEYINIRCVKQEKLLIDKQSKVINWGNYFESSSIIDQIIDHRWISVEELDILVNQGLRTGYNDFFYFERLTIKKLIEKNLIKYESIHKIDILDKYIEELSYEDRRKIVFTEKVILPPNHDYSNDYILLTFNYKTEKGKEIGAINIEKKYVSKAIKSIKNISYYNIDKQKTNYYVLNTNNNITKSDYYSLMEKYDEQLFTKWINEGLSIIPYNVDKYINFYNSIDLMKDGKIMKVSDMPVLKKYQNKPSLQKKPTMWYNLNFTERHLPDMFINRVNSENIYVFLNDLSNKYLIDANFNTLTFINFTEKEKLIYLALFNSTIFKLQLEKNCANLGGGALKVETAGIKISKLPKINELSKYTIKKLIKLSNELLETKIKESNKIIYKIDKIIIQELLTKNNVDTILQCLYKEYQQIVKERITK